MDKIIGLPSDWFCISYPDVKAHPLYLPVELNPSFLLDRAVCYKRTILFGQKEILYFFLFRLGSKDVSSYKNYYYYKNYKKYYALSKIETSTSEENYSTVNKL